MNSADVLFYAFIGYCVASAYFATRRLVKAIRDSRSQLPQAQLPKAQVRK